MNWIEFKPEKLTNPFSTPTMPSYDEIPKEFKGWNQKKWNRLFNDMFFSGIKIIEFIPKSNIGAEDAWAHLRLWASSFEPKHEHKEAAFAYMASVWFDDIKYEVLK